MKVIRFNLPKSITVNVPSFKKSGNKILKEYQDWTRWTNFPTPLTKKLIVGFGLFGMFLGGLTGINNSKPAKWNHSRKDADNNRKCKIRKGMFVGGIVGVFTGLIWPVAIPCHGIYNALEIKSRFKYNKCP